MFIHCQAIGESTYVDTEAHYIAIKSESCEADGGRSREFYKACNSPCHRPLD